jgi:alkylation response protein AidB-like acyl-CoA dehydrogenase
MELGLSDDQQLLVDSFDELFAAESSSARIRAAEDSGFDPALWSTLAATGTLGLRVSEVNGGSGASLFDAVLVLDRAGHHLATGPLAAAIVAANLLARSPGGGGGGGQHLAAALDGSSVISFVPRRIDPDATNVLLDAGAHADAVVLWQADELVLLHRPTTVENAATLGASGFAWWPTHTNREVLATGDDAARLASAAIAEWRILTASALVGLARRSLGLAADYASERVQFDRIIATFQGIAHPLADAVTEMEGARLLIWNSVWTASHSPQEAHALFSMAFAWAAEASASATGTALHTLGGYGLALEYDLQLP